MCILFGCVGSQKLNLRSKINFANMLKLSENLRKLSQTLNVLFNLSGGPWTILSPLRQILELQGDRIAGGELVLSARLGWYFLTYSLG